MTSVTISTIRNSCIVNNANIAVQNENITPLDAMNNWWGMPIGASDQNRAGGDLIGTNILSQPHLITIPPNCDLSDANWIPFNEQELQFAIQSNLPYLNGLDFALLDIVKGQGARFTLVAKPMYGGASGEALITITPAPDGSFIRIMLDVSQLPADPNLSKIATCELMPLFMNSLQHVQNKFTNPSQLLEQLVVMDSALMLLFSPPTEITPEPAPEIIMNYDESCLFDLVVVDDNPETTPEPGEGESLNLVTTPPLEGQFTLLETGTMQESQSNIIFLEVDTILDDANLNACTDELNDCSLRGAVTLATLSGKHHVIQLAHTSYRLLETLIVEGHVTLIGLEPYTTITTNSTQDFTLVDAKNANLTFYNLLIYGGRAQGPSGLVIHRSFVNIYNSRFQSNHSSGYSGAIGIVDEGTGIPSHVYTANTVFMDNRAFMGGAILGYNGNGQATIECSTFENNHAHQGGAIATLHIGTTRFTGQITINRSNMIYNTTAQYGVAAYRNIGNTSGWIEFDSNYWKPLPSNPALPNPNTLYVVQMDDKPQNNRLPLNCDVPPPPTNQQTQCSDPNDFNKLKETNTNLADREACWLRYAGIIYLTIHHEFSLDNALVFNPNELSTQLFQYANNIYDGRLDTGANGVPPELFITSRTIPLDELTPFDQYDNPYSPYYLFARALLNGMGSNKYLVNGTAGPMRYFIQNYRSTISAGWIGGGAFCGGNQATTGSDTGLCFDEDWYSQIVQNNYISKLSYQIVKPHIDNAICDMVYGYGADNCVNFDGVESEPEWMSHILVLFQLISDLMNIMRMKSMVNL